MSLKLTSRINSGRRGVRAMSSRLWTQTASFQTVWKALKRKKVKVKNNTGRKKHISENFLLLPIDKFTAGIDTSQWHLMIRNTTQTLEFNTTSTSANAQNSTEQVRSVFENANLVLVQANGLCLEDNEITRGISITPAWYIHIARSIPSYKQMPQRVSVKSLRHE